MSFEQKTWIKKGEKQMTQKQMNLVIIFVSFLTVLLLCYAIANGQDKPAEVKLKDSVALEIKTQQVKLSEIQKNMLQMQIQFTQLQEQERTTNQALLEKLHTALKDSGLDENRYDLDPTTLTVKARDKVVVQEKK
jgi:preprotein translocase subunit SecF